MTVLETILPKIVKGAMCYSFSKAREQQFVPESHRKAFFNPYDPKRAQLLVE